MAEWRIVPVARPQNDWDHHSIAGGMPLHCPQHFAVVAIVGREEVGADEQQDNVRGVQVVIDFVAKILPRLDSAIVPGVDEPLPLEGRQMLFQPVTQRLISVRV